MMLISLPMQSCYCILSCDESAEYVFLLFHHMFLTKANLECRIAAVLTTSAGSYRRPTMEKCIISRTSLSSEDLSEIEGQLKMNCSNIQITEKDFQEHMYCLSSFTTSSKSVMLLRPLTCHIPVSPGLVARRAR